MPYLSNAERAFVPPKKLRDYCLNLSHPEGRHQARVFGATLGIGQADAEWLAAAILAALPEAPVVKEEKCEFGCRHTVNLEVGRGLRSARIRTGWIVRAGEAIPRLTTCFVL
jgi:hypothetical protein